MQHSQTKWSLSNITPLKAAIRGGRILTVKPSFSSEGNRGTDLLLTEKKGELGGDRRESWIHFVGQINSTKEEADICGQDRGSAFTKHLPRLGTTDILITEFFSLTFAPVLKSTHYYSNVPLNRGANHSDLFNSNARKLWPPTGLSKGIFFLM